MNKVKNFIRDLVNLMWDTDNRLTFRIVRRDQHDYVTHVAFIPFNDMNGRLRASGVPSDNTIYVCLEESDIQNAKWEPA